MRIAVALSLLAALATPQDEALERVELRVVSSAADGAVVVDRGAADGLAAGDSVLFRTRDGATFTGAVREVGERSAVVKLHDRGFRPEPGTRGEARVRGAPAEGKSEEGGGGRPERPEWTNKDESFTPDQPLLRDVRPVRPEERRAELSALVYLLAELVVDSDGDTSNSLFRLGADAVYENPFRRGDRFHVDAEWDVLTEQDEESGTDLLLRRVSYAWGGHRFAGTRFEVGRFLQHGMPEFGVLDGVEWGKRLETGHRFGASVGWMPEPDDDFESFSDLQLAAYYEWVSDPREQLTLAAGFQKSLHNGDADRDLLVAKARYLPAQGGFDLHATLWVDFYTGKDTEKDSFVELTQALLSAGRRFERGDGLYVTFRHLVFPQLLRNEFLPVTPGQLADDRYDRLQVDAWRWFSDSVRVHGDVSLWNDEDGSGIGADLGVDVRDLLGPGSSLDVTVFFTPAQFETLVGARAAYGRFAGDLRWDVLYEFSSHHLDGLPDDADDLLQHRLRLSGSLRAFDGVDVSLYAEGILWDEELSFTLGVNLQKRF